MDVDVRDRNTTPLLVSVTGGLSGYPVVQVHGELDFSNREQFSTQIDRVFADEPAIVILDLRWLTFVDSSGLHVVLRADRLARRRGARLVIVPGPPHVHRVFVWVGLEKRLTFAERVSDVAGTGWDAST